MADSEYFRFSNICQHITFRHNPITITPHSIQKGIPVKLVQDKPAIIQLRKNQNIVNSTFEVAGFVARILPLKSHIGSGALFR